MIVYLFSNWFAFQIDQVLQENAGTVFAGAGLNIVPSQTPAGMKN